MHFYLIGWFCPEKYDTCIHTGHVKLNEWVLETQYEATYSYDSRLEMRLLNTSNRGMLGEIAKLQ